MITRRSRRHASNCYQLGTMQERERVLSVFDKSVELYGDDLLTVLSSLLYHVGNASTPEIMLAHKAMHDRGTQSIN